MENRKRIGKIIHTCTHEKKIRSNLLYRPRSSRAGFKIITWGTGSVVIGQLKKTYFPFLSCLSFLFILFPGFFGLIDKSSLDLLIFIDFALVAKVNKSDSNSASLGEHLQIANYLS